MTASMTAFARTETGLPAGTLAWELRSVNHRFLEVSLRLPDSLRGIEGTVRERLNQALGRGKVDATLRLQGGTARAVTLDIDEAQARALLAAVARVDALAGTRTQPDALDVLRWPGVLVAPEEDAEGLARTALDALEQAIAELQATRAREGAKLAALIEQRCAAIDALVVQARERLPEILARLRERLRQRLAELAAELDPARLEQEIALVAQRMDVAEELDRLVAHLTEVRRVVRQKEPAGRRLDFLMQELNREANTLGSKSQDIETTRISVDLKVLIEQMREQIQNIE